MHVSHCLVALAMTVGGARASAHAQAARGSLVSRDLVARAADSIAAAALKNGPVAALSIAVVRGSDTLVMKGYGLADVENEVPATAQTVHRIGSVTKQFTAVAIMRLVEQRKLTLDDDVTKYVPNAPTRGRRVQIRWEVYNLFNTVNWSNIDTSMQFNPAGEQVDTQFGKATNARDPRIMQGALRFSF